MGSRAKTKAHPSSPNKAERTLLRSDGKAFPSATHPSSLKHPPNPSMVWYVVPCSTRTSAGVRSGLPGLSGGSGICRQGCSPVLLIHVTGAPEASENPTSKASEAMPNRRVIRLDKCGARRNFPVDSSFIKRGAPFFGSCLQSVNPVVHFKEIFARHPSRDGQGRSRRREGSCLEGVERPEQDVDPGAEAERDEEEYEGEQEDEKQPMGRGGCAFRAGADVPLEQFVVALVGPVPRGERFSDAREDAERAVERDVQPHPREDDLRDAILRGDVEHDRRDDGGGGVADHGYEIEERIQAEFPFRPREREEAVHEERDEARHVIRTLFRRQDFDFDGFGAWRHGACPDSAYFILSVEGNSSLPSRDAEDLCAAHDHRPDRGAFSHARVARGADRKST